MPAPKPHPPCIGVFDSGVGGLTVLRSLLSHLPHARYLYLGDTARLPYGSKSRETIVRYAVSAARFLLSSGAGQLVIACNTASALALPEIRSAVAPIPVFGVIEPGARAAQGIRAAPAVQPTQIGAAHRPPTVASLPSAGVLVLATAATVGSHAYRHALAALGVEAAEKSCPLLVPLVEEGWTDHPVTAEILRIYLREAIAEAPNAHTLLLGCTHYPLLRPLLLEVLEDIGHPMTVIDSAEATAKTVAEAEPSRAGLASDTSDLVVYASDSVDRFQALGSRFLGRPLPPVQLINLGG